MGDGGKKWEEREEGRGDVVGGGLKIGGYRKRLGMISVVSVTA